jgi:hypothetical protein
MTHYRLPVALAFPRFDSPGLLDDRPARVGETSLELPCSPAPRMAPMLTATTGTQDRPSSGATAAQRASRTSACSQMALTVGWSSARSSKGLTPGEVPGKPKVTTILNSPSRRRRGLPQSPPPRCSSARGSQGRVGPDDEARPQLGRGGARRLADPQLHQGLLHRRAGTGTDHRQ